MNSINFVDSTFQTEFNIRNKLQKLIVENVFYPKFINSHTY